MKLRKDEREKKQQFMLCLCAFLRLQEFFLIWKTRKKCASILKFSIQRIHYSVIPEDTVCEKHVKNARQNILS